MGALRDFWFPILLFVAGCFVSLTSLYAGGNPRRVILSVAACLGFLGVLSYIWGDPVQGPFARLLRPSAPETFHLHAGVTVGFPVQQLKDGINFSRAVSIPGQPIELWLRRTWWSGWQYRVVAKGPGGQPVISFTHESVMVIPPGWDVNSDGHAVEVVDGNRLPRLQVVQDGEYNVYVNTVLVGPLQSMVFKDDRLEMKPTNALTPQDFPATLFRYPSYANRGRRE